MNNYEKIYRKKGKLENLPISMTYSLFDPIPYNYREKSTLKGSIYVEFEKAKEQVRFFLSTVLGEIPFMTKYGNNIHTLFLENFKSIDEVINKISQEFRKDIISNIQGIDFVSLLAIEGESNLDKNIISLNLTLIHIKSNKKFSFNLNLKNSPQFIDSEDLKIYDVEHM